MRSRCCLGPRSTTNPRRCAANALQSGGWRVLPSRSAPPSRSSPRARGRDPEPLHSRNERKVRHGISEWNELRQAPLPVHSIGASWFVSATLPVAPRLKPARLSRVLLPAARDAYSLRRLPGSHVSRLAKYNRALVVAQIFARCAKNFLTRNGQK